MGLRVTHIQVGVLYHIAFRGEDSALLHSGLSANGRIVQDFIHLFRQAGRNHREVIVHIEVSQLLVIPNSWSNMTAVRTVGQVDQTTQRQFHRSFIQIHADKALEGRFLDRLKGGQFLSQQIQLCQIHILWHVLLKVFPPTEVRYFGIEGRAGVQFQLECIQFFLFHRQFYQPVINTVHFQRTYIYDESFIQASFLPSPGSDVLHTTWDPHQVHPNRTCCQ